MNEKGMNKAKETGGTGVPSMLPIEHIDDIAANYTVKYFKGSIDEPSEVMQLQSIETKSMLADEIIMTDRQTYSFEGAFFVVLRYLEKRP